MNAEKLMNAIGCISNRHIVEFSEIKTIVPQKRIWLKIVSIAACFLVVIAISLIGNDNRTPGGSVSAVPFVKINEKIYVIDPNYPASTTNELPDGYVIIGTIERNPSTYNPHELINGDAIGCIVGEAIYQHPSSTNEIFVWTTLFSGEGEYRFVRFISKE